MFCWQTGEAWDLARDLDRFFKPFGGDCRHSTPVSFSGDFLSFRFVPEGRFRKIISSRFFVTASDEGYVSVFFGRKEGVAF